MKKQIFIILLTIFAQQIICADKNATNSTPPTSPAHSRQPSKEISASTVSAQKSEESDGFAEKLKRALSAFMATRKNNVSGSDADSDDKKDAK